MSEEILQSEKNNFFHKVRKIYSRTDLFNIMKLFSPTDLPILLVGKKGTGKELIARAIHRLSSFKASPFYLIRCSTLTRDTFLAFLAGDSTVEGAGEQTEDTVRSPLITGGTLYLHDLTALTADVQVLVTHLLEKKKIMELSHIDYQPYALRIIGSAPLHIERLLKKGIIRDDLFYAFTTVVVKLPVIVPLDKNQDMNDELDILIEHFLQQEEFST